MSPAAWVFAGFFVLAASLLVVAMGGNAHIAKENRRLRMELRQAERLTVALARRNNEARAKVTDVTPLYDRIVCERLEREFGGPS